MSLPSAVGFPLMHLEAGERRAFLPCLMPAVQAAGAAAIVVERGYGEAMGVEAGAYLEASPIVRFGSPRRS